MSAASLTLGLGGLVAFAPVAAASAQATVRGNGNSVNLRSAPSTSAPVVGSEPDGARITIVCTSRGDTVNGNWGPTSLWDKLDVGSFISDGFVYTGTNNPVAPDCGGSAPPPSGGNGSPYGDMPHGLSIHGYAFGQCTDYVAWRLDRAGVSVNYGAFPGDWNANRWADHARALGFRVDHTPEVGAVAQLTSGAFGHVAVVYKVNPDGSVMVEDYNWNFHQTYAQHSMTHVDNFIHFR